MANLKKVKLICNICHGNGYIRVATGDTSIDFRDNSQVHQCWECDSQGEFYEYVSEDNIVDVPNDDHSINYCYRNLTSRILQDYLMVRDLYTSNVV